MDSIISNKFKDELSANGTILDNFPIGIFQSTVEGKFLYVNPALSSMLGYSSPQEFIDTVNRQSIADVMYEDPQKRPYVVQRIQNNPSELQFFESRYRRKDGSVIDAILYIGQRLSPTTNTPYFYGFIQDITERKRLDEAIQRRITALTQPSTDGTASLEFEDLFEIERIQSFQDGFSNAAGVASIITRLDGSPLTKPSNFLRLFNDMQEAGMGCADCMSSMQREHEGHAIEIDIRPCLSGGIWTAGARIMVNEKHIANWFIGQVRNEEYDVEDVLEFADALGMDRDSFYEAFLEIPIMPRERFESIAQALFLFSKELSVRAYQNLQQARVIAERNRSAEELRASQHRYRLLFSSMEPAFAYHEIIRNEAGRPCDYRFLEINPSFEQMTGLKADDLVGRRVLEVMPNTEPYWIEMYGRVVVTGEPVRFEHYSSVLNRYYEVYAYSPEPEHFAVLFHDVTERINAEKKRLEMERRLQQSQKLESLGVLAGGIAHDFNNLLMVILGHAEMVLADLPPASSASEDLHQIENATRRAADLCHQMLTYSGKGKFIIEQVNLCDIVKEMALLLQTSISKKTTVLQNLESNTPDIAADPSQMRQVAMNLMINAAEAIGDKNGVISISVGAMECSAEYLKGSDIQNTPAPGTYVYLDVSDTGCGMDEATRRRIFEPFFTTKFAGRGLGMATVMGIVFAHKGAIFVHSIPGEGTTFRALFPAIEAGRGTQDHGGPIAPEIVWNGSGTILLVDDEETVRIIGKKMLSTLGFTVLTASDGVEALRIYYEKKEEIALVLLDMMMPNMDGVETFRELRRIDPDAKIVLSSGYPEQEILSRFELEELSGFIQKPYSAARLRETLMGVLRD